MRKIAATVIESVILPARNEGDVEEVPEELRRQMQFILVSDAEQVLSHALAPATVSASV